MWCKDSGSCANLVFQEAFASFLWVEGMSSVYCQVGGEVQAPLRHCWRKGVACSREESLGSTPCLQRCGAASQQTGRGEFALCICLEWLLSKSYCPDRLFLSWIFDQRPDFVGGLFCLYLLAFPGALLLSFPVWIHKRDIAPKKLRTSPFSRCWDLLLTWLLLSTSQILFTSVYYKKCTGFSCN